MVGYELLLFCVYSVSSFLYASVLYIIYITVNRMAFPPPPLMQVPLWRDWGMQWWCGRLVVEYLLLLLA